MTKKLQPAAGDPCVKCGVLHVTPSGSVGCIGHKTPARGGMACKRAPARGQRVCRAHGGGAPQAKEAAAKRLAEAEATKILATYARDAGDVDPGEKLLDLICWGSAKVNFYRQRVLLLKPSEYTWGRTRSKTGGDDRGTTHEAKPNAWVVLLREAEQDLARFCVDALKVGLKERELDIAARMADKIVPILDAVLAEFGHDPKLPEVAEKVARVLRAV